MKKALVIGPKESYLKWLVGDTHTTWWHDSADPDELKRGLEHGATGVTTNPVLVARTLSNNRSWLPKIKTALSADCDPEQQAEALTRVVVTQAAARLEPQHERTSGRLGYVCAQVNPARAGDRETMLSMAKRFHSWAPNIAVKLPVTAAGLDVLEECTAEGITITATVSFTVPQVIAVAERYRRGIRRAEKNGRKPGQCFAVIMIGRLEDYLRDVAKDWRADISESDIRQVGLAIAKRAYSIFHKRGYEAVLIVAALRGTYHVTELAGAELIMSIHPRYQAMLLSEGVRREERIDLDIPPDVIGRLSALPEFVRAYERNAMTPEEYIAYGATQRTLSQFSEAGWKLLESLRVS